VHAVWRYRLLKIGLLGERGHEYVSFASLRNANLGKINHTMINRIAETIERPERTPDRSFAPVQNSRDVLYQNMLRVNDFDESRHALIESVPTVPPSGVVVEVRISLTRWPREQNVDVGKFATEASLFTCGSCVEFAI
jgi:hypothetical protein